MGVELMNLSRRSLGSFCAALAVSFAITGGASQAFAGPITFPSIEISIEGNSAKFTYSPSDSDYRRATNADGGYELNEQKHFDILGNLAHLTIEQLQWDPDPFVLNNILVTNTTDSTLIFSAFVGLPTTFPAPNFISGNVSTSVIDGGRAGGATVATVGGQALYAAQIDGATVATLLNDPFSVIAPDFGSNTASAAFGPFLNGVPVTSHIGIQLRFSLTPGDSASFLSRFDVVESVPDASSSAALVVIALPFVVAMTARSRRRKGKPSP